MTSRLPAVSRRAVLAAAAGGALARPALAQGSRTLKFVPAANLVFLDPIYATSAVSGTHGFMVFDTLYGLDGNLAPRPQMAEGHDVVDNGRTWLIRLRPGLRFHDGEPVLARDCVASLIRWSKRDGFGQSLGANVEAWEAADDRTIRIRLKRPIGPLLLALAHTTVSSAFIMPERLARTDPNTQITEMVGSGPFRFLKDEFVTGSHVGYARFDGYVPRDEPAEWTAGGKRVNFDRVEWHIIPDPATAAAAVQTGEVDWWEYVLPDLVPSLARNPALQIQNINRFGLVSVLRFNFMNPPFNNPALRRAILSAVDQNDYLHAVVGDDPKAGRTCFSMFACDIPGGRETAAAVMTPPRDLAKARAAVVASGYAGERVVLFNPTDYAFINACGNVTADMLRRLGMNVDVQEMEFGTMMSRRNNRGPVEKGGWSIFHTGANADGMGNPGMNYYIRGQGAAGWPGWFENADIERLSDAWMAETDPARSLGILDEIQRIAADQVPFVPLGQWYFRSVLQSGLRDLVQSTYSLFWNVRRG
jgi:peptide/nickel transport system substrate-binding protein